MNNLVISMKEEIMDEAEPPGMNNLGISMKEEIIGEAELPVPTINIKEEATPQNINDGTTCLLIEIDHLKEKMDVNDLVAYLTMSHQCPHCEYNAKTKTNLQIHIESQHKTQNLEGILRDEEALSLSQLKRYIVVHHTGEKPYQCSHCNYKSVDKYNLRRHLVIHHTTGGKHYQCLHCDYKTDNNSDLNRHIVVLHTTGGKPCKELHKCPQCNFKTEKINILSKHMQNHVDLDEMGYHCAHCNHKASSFPKIKRHQKIHHKPEKIQLKKNILGINQRCPHCEYKAVTKHDLKLHIMTRHNCKKPICCPHCEFISVCKYRLRVHIKDNHTNANIINNDEVCSDKSMGEYGKEIKEESGRLNIADKDCLDRELFRKKQKKVRVFTGVRKRRKEHSRMMREYWRKRKAEDVSSKQE